MGMVNMMKPMLMNNMMRVKKHEHDENKKLIENHANDEK